MTGRNEHSAVPTVIFSCNDADTRKKIRRSILRSGIFERYPGFESIYCNREPGFSCNIPLMDGSHGSVKISQQQSIETRSIVTMKSLSHNVHGAHLRVIVRGQDATVGGILRWKERLFLTTAGHVFDASLGSIFADKDDALEWELDIDGSEDELDMNDGTSRENGTSERTSLTAHTLPSQNRYIDESLYSVESIQATSSNNDHSTRGDVPSFFLNTPFISSIDGLSPLLDVALFEMPSEIASKVHNAPQETPKQKITSVVAQRPQAVDVLVVTGDDPPVRAHLSDVPTFAKVPKFSKHQELWTIYNADRLKQGYCGAWVVDAQDGTVYGHLVTGSPQNRNAHIIPLRDVLINLQERFDSTWSVALDIKFQTSNDGLGDTDSLEHTSSPLKGSSITTPEPGTISHPQSSLPNTESTNLGQMSKLYARC